MKAYITCPVSHTKERLDLLPIIKETVEFVGVEPFVFIVGGEPADIFDRDYKQLKSCDVIIAEVSDRSHGVGIEIGMSYCLGLKRILLIQEGNFVTKLAQGMPNTVFLKYSDDNDLRNLLTKELKNI